MDIYCWGAGGFHWSPLPTSLLEYLPKTNLHFPLTIIPSISEKNVFSDNKKKHPNNNPNM